MSDSPTGLAIDPLQMAEMRTQGRYALIAKAILLLCTVTSPLWLTALFFTAPRWLPYLSSLFCVPVLAILCAGMFTFVWRGDSFLKLLFGAGILARLAFTGLYVWVGYVIYNSGVDAFHYWTAGCRTADSFASLGWSAFEPPYWSTNLIGYICAIITLMIGSSIQTLFVLFAFAALWGGYFFYRAFCIAFPEGDRRLYGLLVVLLPSTLFWSSAISKDALEQLFIGITAFAFANLMRRLSGDNLVLCGLGILGVMMVRPHIAVMLAMSMIVPFVISKTHGGWKTAAAKVILVPLLLGGTAYIASQAKVFLEDTTGQVTGATVDQITRNNQIGGSAFNQGQSLAVRAVQAPFLIFRPFPWEARGGMAVLASAEGLWLMWFAWKKRKVFRAGIRRWREPYICFILVYALLFAVTFAATSSNFGIIARQRIMLLPLLLMLFCTKFQYVAPRVVRLPGMRNPRLAGMLPVPRIDRVRF